MNGYLFLLKFFALVFQKMAVCRSSINVLTTSIETNVTSSKGNIVYSATSANPEERIWTFSLQHARSGRPFVTRLLDFRTLDDTQPSYKKNTLILPDGNQAFDLASRDYWTQNATCWMYINAATLESDTCAKKYSKMKSPCTQIFLCSTNLPLKIKTQLARHAMILQYEFLDCEGLQLLPSSATQSTRSVQLTTHATKIVTSSRESSNTSVLERLSTSSTITTTLARGNEVQSHLASREVLLYVVVALAITLAAVTVLLCAALCTLRKLKRSKTEGTAKAIGNGKTGVSATSRSNFYLDRANIDSQYTMANDVDECLSLNNQTVENVLYEETK